MSISCCLVKLFFDILEYTTTLLRILFKIIFEHDMIIDVHYIYWFIDSTKGERLPLDQYISFEYIYVRTCFIGFIDTQHSLTKSLFAPRVVSKVQCTI